MTAHRTFALTALVGALALSLAACAAPAGEVPAPSASGAAASASAEPTTSAEPHDAAEPTASPDTSTWLEYATDDGSVSFRYPEDWTLESDSEQIGAEGEDVDPDARWMDWAELTAPNGQQLLAFYDYIDIGGACGGDSVQPLEVLATEPASAKALNSDDAVIATVALGTVDGRWRVGVGITAPERLEHAATCVVYFVGVSSDGGVGFGTHFQLSSTGEDTLWTVDSLEDARAYMETDEYRTVLEILRSFESA